MKSKMKDLHLASIALILSLAGCNNGSMTSSAYDGATGKGETKFYSKYYDAGDWISIGEVGLSVVVDHEKTVVPILHGIQTSLGALGPSDLEATGKVTLYNWNASDAKRQVIIKKVTSQQHTIQMKGKPVTLEPRSRSGGEIGSFPIPNYGTEIPVTVTYELDGKPGVLSLKLTRRTHEELKRYFGPNGRPPYPWYNQN
jgi:hypothetical protein